MTEPDNAAPLGYFYTLELREDVGRKLVQLAAENGGADDIERFAADRLEDGLRILERQLGYEVAPVSLRTESGTLIGALSIGGTGKALAIRLQPGADGTSIAFGWLGDDGETITPCAAADVGRSPEELITLLWDAVYSLQKQATDARWQKEYEGDPDEDIPF